MLPLFRPYLRWRHSRGYGVHSPFAYAMLKEAIRPPRGYTYYHELSPGMTPRRRMIYRLRVFLRRRRPKGAAPALHHDFEAWQRDQSSLAAILIFSPSHTVRTRIEAYMTHADTGVIFDSPRFILAVKNPDMHLLRYEIQ